MLLGETADGVIMEGIHSSAVILITAFSVVHP
jgi:hypothetical protein